MAPTLQLVPHIREVRVLSTSFKTALAKFGCFLAQEGLTHLFVAQVGHYHFTYGRHKRLWEAFDARNRELTTRVISRRRVSAGRPVAWQFVHTGKAIPTTWSSQGLGIAVADRDLQEALVKVGAFLARERLARVLTVRMLGACIPVLPHEAALETTDTQARTQVVRPVLLSTVSARQVSTWRFTVVGDPVVAAWCYEADVEHNGDSDVEDDG